MSVVDDEIEVINDESTDVEPESEAISDIETPKQIELQDGSLYTLSPDVKVNEDPAITYFKGVPVKYISFTSESIPVDANSIYDGIEVYRFKGILRDFTVTTNDENFEVFVQIKDHENGRIVINDKSMKKISLIGRGISHGETQPDVTGSSRDVVGVRHPIKPYLMRYKNQPSGGLTNYDDYKGTDDDLYITLDYAPTDPYEFTELVFRIVNTNVQGGGRIIHYLELGILKVLTDLERANQGAYIMPKDAPDAVDDIIFGTQKKAEAAKAFLNNSPLLKNNTKNSEYRVSGNRYRKIANIVSDAEDQG
jgi:hypothetical protein